MQVLVRNKAERLLVSFTPFPLIITSCKTIGKYHPQDIGTDIVRIQDISTTTWIPPVSPFVSTASFLPVSPFFSPLNPGSH